MRNLFALFGLAALMFLGCSDDPSSRSISGFGTVERSEVAVAVHHYGYCIYAKDTSEFRGLDDGARVYFDCRATPDDADDTKSIFWGRFGILSRDITSHIVSTADSLFLVSDSLRRLAKSAEGFQAKSIHVSRDWRRNDFLNATLIYPGATDSTDRDMVAYVRTPDEVNADGDSCIVLWLRLCRARRDSAVYVTRHISVPVSCLQDSARERVFLKLKRLNYNGDTISTDFIYSYANFLD